MNKQFWTFWGKPWENISSVSLILHFNPFLGLEMLRFCCGNGLDENLEPWDG